MMATVGVSKMRAIWKNVMDEYVKDRFCKTTFRHIVIASGSINLMSIRTGTNMPNDGRERMYRVNAVTKRWNAAKPTWLCRNDGSSKMDLLVKT